MEKTTYLCDCGQASQPCRKETTGYHIMLVTGRESSVRWDLCEYHVKVMYAALRDNLRFPRDPAEAACP